MATVKLWTDSEVEADRRIPHLLSVPAKVHFLSCEPLLERVSLRWLPVFPTTEVSTSCRLFRVWEPPIGIPMLVVSWPV